MSAEPVINVLWLLLLGIELALVAGLFAIIQRQMTSAVWRRTFAQSAICGVLMVAVFELSGMGRGITGWIMGIGTGRGASRGAQTQQATKLPNVSVQKDALRPRLTPEFRDEVHARLEQIAERRWEAKPVPLSEMNLQQPQSAIPAENIQSASIQTVRNQISDSIGVSWVLLIWAGGTVAVAARAFLGRCLFIVFRSRRRKVTDALLLDRVNSLARKVGLSRKVRVVESAALGSPIAFGILHPTIGLPQDFAQRFSAGQQEAMLAHELAHLATHDPLWCLVADATSALLWWHPAVWWLRRQLQVASELVADEASLVVARGPELLAECLVEIGSLMTRTPLLGQLHMAGFNSCLGKRVQRLVHLENGSWSPFPRIRSILVRILGALTSVVVIILCTGWVIPGSLTKGETMKSIQLNWKHSLAAVALLAAANTLQPAAAVEAPSTLAAATAKLIVLKNAMPSDVVEQLQNKLESKGSRVEADDRTRQLVVLASDKEIKPIEQAVAQLDKPNQIVAADAASPPTYVPAPSAAPGGPEVEEAYRRYGIRPGRPGAMAAAPGLGRRQMPGEPGMPNRSGQLESKLRDIVLEEVSFDNLPLSEVLKTLSDDSRKYGKDKRGINFLIDPNAPAMAPMPGSPIDPATGLPMPVAAAEAVDVSSVTIKLSMPLRDVTMKDVLDAIVKVADRPIEYSLEDYGVVFSLRPDFVAQATVPMVPHAPLSVRTFKVDTNTFVAGLESAFGIKIDSANAGPGARSPKIQSALRELLTQLGVSMEGNKAVFYNELTGIVMCRATYEDLDVFHAAISTLGGEIIGPFGQNDLTGAPPPPAGPRR